MSLAAIGTLLNIGGLLAAMCFYFCDDEVKGEDFSGWVYTCMWIAAIGMFLAWSQTFFAGFLVAATLEFFFGCYWRSKYLNRNPWVRVDKGR
jgi:hypothetical protein